MHPYQPQKIVVDSEVLQLPFTTRVLAKFPKIQDSTLIVPKIKSKD